MFVLVLILSSFHKSTPVLVINESAKRVFTLGILRFEAVLVGYLWIELFLVNKLLKIGGKRELLNLNINIPTFSV